jgi:hypothetical protein
VQALCSLPSAQQLETYQANLLLGRAVRCGKAYELLDSLLTLPAVQQLESGGLACVRKEALLVRNFAAVEQLLLLEGFTSPRLLDEMISLLQLQRDTETSDEAARVFQRYCELTQTTPGFHSKLLHMLLQAALQNCRHPPGACSSGSSTAAAVDWVQQLLLLPEAQQLSTSAVDEMLRVALQQLPAVVPLLCQLAPAQQLSLQEVQGLLLTAVTTPLPGCQTARSSCAKACRDAARHAVSCICQLPNAQQMQPGFVAARMNDALQRGRPELLLCLGGIEGMLDGAAMFRLLVTAIQRRSNEVGGWDSLEHDSRTTMSM